MSKYAVVIGTFTSTKGAYRTELVEAVSEQAATDSVNLFDDEFWACTNLVIEQDKCDLDDFDREDAEYVAYLLSNGHFDDPLAVALEALDEIPF